MTYSNRFQDTLWNNIFAYAYPISFMGSIAYAVLAIMQLSITDVIANRNWVVVINTVIGLCGLFAFAKWYNTDLTLFDPITHIVQLDTTETKLRVQPTN